MPNIQEFSKVSVLIVGAGPAGLAAAIRLKALRPGLDVCVIDKACGSGHHNLSGAVLEKEPLQSLLDAAAPGWENTDEAKTVLANRIDRDDILFMPCPNKAINVFGAISAAKALGMGWGQMAHHGDYSVSISKLTRWLADIARKKGVELLHGFAADSLILNEAGTASGVRLVDQGVDKEGEHQPNYVKGETIEARFVVLAEGCDGLVTERFVEAAGLKRESPQLYSVGVKELISVTPEQYGQFSAGRVIHAMGYPIWVPVVGPEMFGGGIVYAGEANQLAVGMIVGLDWRYIDFNPQDALIRFKEHPAIKKYIEGGTVVEAGAKMIPEGGWRAVPRDPRSGSIGRGNVLILGDSAGFVNMFKIKGLHNAINSGILAAGAIAASIDKPEASAAAYTREVENSNIAKEMKGAAAVRQTIARLGPLFGMPLSVLGGMLPQFEVEPDYRAMKKERYRFKPAQTFDKDTFTAMAGTEHREEQPSHLKIGDRKICETKCTPVFGSPCITFCPAGVYETIHDEVKPANPSNCLHCKTCQRKCPFDNIRWTAPEGGGGPRYKSM